MTMKMNQIESELTHEDNIRGHLEKLFKDKHALTIKCNNLGGFLFFSVWSDGLTEFLIPLTASELEQLKILVPDNVNEKCKEVSIIHEKLSTVDMVLEDHHNTLK